MSTIIIITPPPPPDEPENILDKLEKPAKHRVDLYGELDRDSIRAVRKALDELLK